MKKRTAAGFIAAALCIAVCLSQSSCGFIVFNTPGADSDSTAVTTEPDVTTGRPSTEPAETAPPRDLRAEAEQRLAKLPDYNLSASSVIIATAVSPDLVCPSGETESEVTAARTLSVRAVEEKFRTKIIANSVSVSELLERAKAAYASDMYYADLLVLPQSMVGSFYAAGILANMNSLPFADYSQPWYDSRVNESALLGNTQLAVSGAASYDPDGLSCVYFNRTLAGDTDIYSLVTAGKWTLESYAELAKNAAAIDGVSGHGSGFDRTGYIDAVAASMGLDYVTNERGQLPELLYMEDSSMAERAGKLVDKLYSLIFDDKTYTEKDALGAFDGGKLMFLTDTLAVTADLAESKTSWGLLPMPKLDEAQTGYYSPMSADSPVFCALANTPNSVTSGLILEGLNAVCYEYIYDVYFSELKNYRLRDNQSINMLGYIMDSASTDFVGMMSSGFKNLAAATSEAVRNAVLSTSSLESIYRRYSTAASRELASSTVIY